jgi:hypothetical protein
MAPLEGPIQWTIMGSSIEYILVLAWSDPGRTVNPLFLTVFVKPEPPIKTSQHIIFALILINAPPGHFVLYFLSQFGNEKSKKKGSCNRHYKSPFEKN